MRVPPPEMIGIKQQLARRLLPLAVGIGLLIALVAPLTYWLIEHRNLQHVADLYASDLAEKLREVAKETPELWKYQTYKFMAIAQGFHPTIDLLGLQVRDEMGVAISGFERNRADKQFSATLGFADEFRQTLGSAPIEFNNRRVGTVDVLVTDARLRRNVFLILCCSTLVGATLGGLAYLYPLRVVARMEASIRELIGAVQESEQRYRSLVNNIPDVTWTADQQGNTLFISPNVSRVFGFSQEELYREPSLWFGRIHPDDLERVKDAFVALFIEQGSFDVEYRFQRQDGEWVWIHDRALAAYQRGETFCADGIFTDVTERKQLEMTLAEQTRGLREALARVKTLGGLIPICAGCKKIRDDKGYWNQIESYISQHSDALFSHGYCPDCLAEAYAEIERLNAEKPPY